MSMASLSLEEFQDAEKLEEHRLCSPSIINVDTSSKKLQRSHALRVYYGIKGKRPNSADETKAHGSRIVHFRAHVTRLRHWKGNDAM